MSAEATPIAIEAPPVEQVVAERLLRMVFQPLVRFETGRVFAYEALCRPTAPGYPGPPALFDAAARAGMAGALGRVVRELAVAGCPDYPLFLNLHPNEFEEGWLVRPDDPVFLHDREVYLEITESVPLSHFAQVQPVLEEVRGKGCYLVVDDLGAGYSNLKYIADLAPEVVKLDRQLVSRLDQEPRLQRLVRSLVRLCEDMGASVVAEGIETLEEYQAAAATGAHFGQGYFIARPAEVPPQPSSAIG